MALTKDEQLQLIMGKGSWQTNKIESKSQGLMLADGPHGLRKEAEMMEGRVTASVPATCFPPESAASCSWDLNLIEKMGEAISKEAKANDVNIILGPGVNIKRSPLCGRNFEYFSEDPFLSGTLAAAYINGVQKNGIGTSLKHFCANNQETNRMTSNSQIDERALREIYLAPFEIAVKNAKPATIMASYNYLNGIHATENKELLTKILRDEWGFQGAVISDWGACISPEKSIPSGLDLEMPENQFHKNRDIPEDALSAAAGRVMELAEKLAKNSSKMTNTSKELLSQNHELAVQIECESAVLLKNDGMLPLTDKKQKIIIVGDLAEHLRFQGGGSSHINATHTPNAIDAFMQAEYTITYLPGYSSTTDKTDLHLEREALSEIEMLTKQNRDIPILFFGGLTDCFEGEGYDRTTLSIPQNQISLFEKIHAINKNIAWINISGSAVEMPFIDKVRAVLHLYLGGQGADEAVVRLVSGMVNPSGKLTESFPLKLSDTPCYNYFVKGYDIEYRESIFVGYRYYTTYKRPVLFPFGHGLSYTSFLYSNAIVLRNGIQISSVDASDFNHDTSNQIEVAFTLKNVGMISGSEVSQVYVKNPKGNFLRPELELVGFQKTKLNAAEEKQVKIVLSERIFKIWDEEKHNFVIVPGEYEIFIASSSEDFRLAVRINVSGDEYKRYDKERLSEYFKQGETEFKISSEQFKTLYGKELSHFNNLKKGEYSKYCSLEQLAKKSVIAKIFLAIATKIISKTFKSIPKNDPVIKMILQTLKEGTIECIVAQSGGKIDYKIVEKIIKSANK